MRYRYQSVLDDLRILHELREFHPMLIGTPPLGIDIASSDIDIACYSANIIHFREVVELRYGERLVRTRHIEVREGPAACITLRSHGWDIELFCQAIPVEQQWGVRHFQVEQRLLKLAPELRERIRQLKRQGLNTEPAFALALRLNGDPYEAILALEQKKDAELKALLASSRY